MEEEDRPLVHLLKPVLSLGDRLQRKAPELPPGDQVHGEFKPRRFIPQPDLLQLGNRSDGTKPPVFDLQPGEEEMPLRVVSRQEG